MKIDKGNYEIGEDRHPGVSHPWMQAPRSQSKSGSPAGNVKRSWAPMLRHWVGACSPHREHLGALYPCNCGDKALSPLIRWRCCRRGKCHCVGHCAFRQLPDSCWGSHEPWWWYYDRFDSFDRLQCRIFESREGVWSSCHCRMVVVPKKFQGRLKRRHWETNIRLIFAEFVASGMKILSTML